MHSQAISADSLAICSPAQGGRSPPSALGVDAAARGTPQPGVHTVVDATLVRRNRSCTFEPRPISVWPSRPWSGVLALQPGRPANERVQPPRSSPDQPGSRGRRHRPLRVRQPGQSGHGHPDRQLLPDAGPGRRSRTTTASATTSPTASTSTTTAMRSRTSSTSGTSTPRSSTRNLPLQHRADRLAR